MVELLENLQQEITGTIDGLPVTVPKDTTILEAASLLGITIPTLCFHQGLPPDGNCRLCLVEFKGRLVASCVYPLRTQSFEVLTQSPSVRRARAFIISLMLARAPLDPKLLSLAAAYEVKGPVISAVEADGCLRCGLCVRACQAGGEEAISLVGRGFQRKVSGPFFEPPVDCVGCLACANVCPTGIITFTQKGFFRTIWGRTFELVRCPQCGRPFATAGELKRGDGVTICPDCRRRKLAKDLEATLELAPRACA
jgi:NADH dehydrogenase/NADH:ubiquinone oxidoreductase subunit G